MNFGNAFLIYLAIGLLVAFAIEQFAVKSMLKEPGYKPSVQKRIVVFIINIYVWPIYILIFIALLVDCMATIRIKFVKGLRRNKTIG